MDLAHRITKISLSKFNSLPKSGKPILNKEWTVLSTILQHDTNSDSLLVVSLGTGTKCLNGSDLEHQGTKINDSHAEVMARRGFVRYLFEQIRLKYVKLDKDTIFEENFIDQKLKLKQKINFHFFTTHLPCGDASISQHSEVGPPEAKRARLEEGNEQDTAFYTGARLVFTQHQDSMVQVSGIRTKPGRGVRTLSVSCTDKLFKWNLMGVQGGLLSTLILDPIYFKSFTLIGYPPEKAELSLRRALVERYESKVALLKPPFKLNPLVIHALSEQKFLFSQMENSNPCPSSIVWCLCEERPHEVAVDGKKLGATKKQQGPKGRLLISKIEILRSYLTLLGQVNEFKCALFPEETDLASKSYDKVKNCAKIYNEQWKTLVKDCVKQWTVKSDNLNTFIID